MVNHNSTYRSVNIDHVWTVIRYGDDEQRCRYTMLPNGSLASSIEPLAVVDVRYVDVYRQTAHDFPDGVGAHANDDVRAVLVDVHGL